MNCTVNRHHHHHHVCCLEQTYKTERNVSHPSPHGPPKRTNNENVSSHARDMPALVFLSQIIPHVPWAEKKIDGPASPHIPCSHRALNTSTASPSFSMSNLPGAPNKQNDQGKYIPFSRPLSQRIPHGPVSRLPSWLATSAPVASALLLPPKPLPQPISHSLSPRRHPFIIHRV